MITTALQFSGGKDSLAILHLWRDKLDETVVMWVNTGAAYPNTVKQMKTLRQTVPHFLEIPSNQPQQIRDNGFPSDIVPIHFTNFGLNVHTMDYSRPVRIQASFSCCFENIWRPMHEAVKQLGVSQVIRGQRNAERYKNPIHDGHVEDGITYRFPIEDWTDDQVMKYLLDNNVEIPSYYKDGEGKSHDCWSCTAYLDEDSGRIHNLPSIQRADVIERLKKIKRAVALQVEPMEQILDYYWEV